MESASEGSRGIKPHMKAEGQHTKKSASIMVFCMRSLVVWGRRTCESSPCSKTLAVGHREEEQNARFRGRTLQRGRGGGVGSNYERLSPISVLNG